MARKIYKRIGIRRDKNLADLSDTKEGLNNLLDALKDFGDSTFFSEDLDVIRNIFSENLTSGQYQKFIGSRTQKTNPTGTLTDLLPPTTYQNKLDKYLFFSGEPRLNGGNGLTASYYDQDQINIGTATIFSGTPFDSDNFWEAGNFNYTGKITPLANNSNGGIEWNGYFMPTLTGPHEFRYSATASFTFEFEDVAESGTITERMRVGTDHVISSDYPGVTDPETGAFDPQVAFGATITASGSAGNVITLASSSNVVKVGVGMSVTGPNVVKDSKVHNVNQTTGEILLRHPNVTEPDAGTPAITGTISSQPITFYRNNGVDVRKVYTSPTLIAYNKYRIRYRYFSPTYVGAGNTTVEVDISGVSRNADINYRPPSFPTESNMPFYFFYGIDYDFSDNAKGTFPKFMDNSILFGGGTIGSSSNKDQYVKVKTNKKIDIKYQAPTSLTAITKASLTCGLTNGSTVGSTGSTAGVEIGNYVFGTNIPEGTRVVDYVTNQYVIFSQTATGGGNQSLTFIDHRGFVKKVTGSTSGNVLTISNGDTTNLKTDMIAIMSGQTSDQQYTGITTTGSTNTVNIFPSQGFGTRSIYFYESKGLRNDSLLQYCQPNIAQCLIVDGAVSATNTVITVTSIPAGTNNWTVRGFQFADDTTITINTPGTNQITLSKPTINDLVDGEKISIAPATNGDRTLCCPPVDTSPPFTPTEEGLETTSGFPNLELNGGSIKFDNLTVLKDITVSNYTDGDTSSKYLDLDANGVSYKILCE